MGGCEVRPIPGYEKYSVSSDGTVYNQDGSVKKPGIRSNYLTVGLCPEPMKRKSFLVHRLVAAAFLGLDLEDLDTQVNHKDLNKMNCDKSNLELVNQSENILHSRAYLRGSDSETHKKCRDCDQIKLRCEFNRMAACHDNLAPYCRDCAKLRTKTYKNRRS